MCFFFCFVFFFFFFLRAEQHFTNTGCSFCISNPGCFPYDVLINCVMKQSILAEFNEPAEVI